ncbi:hypothetical protein [Bradyrhizobium genosp. P]|uniref:hypothetical protein n=1 Tax=Bradyrhizobium genosp. P TaxID=83641 RepID=UPI003CE90D00
MKVSNQMALARLWRQVASAKWNCNTQSVGKKQNRLLHHNKTGRQTEAASIQQAAEFLDGLPQVVRVFLGDLPSLIGARRLILFRIVF